MSAAVSQDNSFRDESGIIAVMLKDIPHCGRGDMGEFLSGRYDNSLNLGSEAAVGVCDGPFGLEVDHVSNPSHNMTDTELAAGIDSKVVILDDGDSFHPCSRLADNIEFLVHLEEAALVLIDTDGDNDLVEHGKRPVQNIQMTCCERIERSRE